MADPRNEQLPRPYRHLRKYRFVDSEPGLHVEVLLPWRSGCQGTIFDALTAGFNEHHVRAFLAGDLVEDKRQKARSMDSVVDFLRFGYPELLHKKSCTRSEGGCPHRIDAHVAKQGWSPTSMQRGHIEERFLEYEPVFSGYSLHTVDGVFFDQEGWKTWKAPQLSRNATREEEQKWDRSQAWVEKRRRLLCEERTQVVRIAFRIRPDTLESQFASSADAAAVKALWLERLTPSTSLVKSITLWLLYRLDMSDRLLRRFRSIPRDQRDPLVETMIDDLLLRELCPDQLEEVRAVVPCIAVGVSNWLDDCALFLFGYLLPHFIDAVTERYATLDSPGEKEIWVTSFMPLNINATTLTSG